MATRSKIALLAMLAMLAVALASSTSASALPQVTKNLRITPAPGSLALRWGISRPAELAGFRVRWRAISPLDRSLEEPLRLLALPWSEPVELSPRARHYTITGLAAEPYEVKVRAILTTGFGGQVKGIGIPLPSEGAEEPPVEEEPPEEEPPVEEEPTEEEPPVEEEPAEEEPPVEEGRVVPENVTRPLITGAALTGETLKVSTGTWTGSPSSFAYQWQDCNSAGAACANITGASASSYKLKASDVGHTVRAVVRAENEAGSSAVSSAATALVSAPSSGEALFLSPSGKDSSPCTQAQPCLSMGHAYEKASAGQAVQMLAGSYPSQTIPGSSKAGSAHVLFAPAPGASVTLTGTIYVFGSHVTIEGMSVKDVVTGNYDQSPGRPNPTDVSLLNLTGRNFEIDSATNVTVEGGSWGPASACGGPYGGNNNSIRQTIPAVAPENILINDTIIHDVQSYDLIECHIEGLAIFAGNHVTVSNSKFYGNSIYDVFIQANSGGKPSNVTISRNWMANAVDNSAANGHPKGYANGIVLGSEISSNLTLAANRFNGPVNINDDGSISSYSNTSVLENFGAMPYSGYPCATALKGVSWSKNVWQNDKCGATDVNLLGLPLPYLKASNDSSLDYTLTGVYAGS
jgi:hypothetical protein